MGLPETAGLPKYHEKDICGARLFYFKARQPVENKWLRSQTKLRIHIDCVECEEG